MLRTSVFLALYLDVASACDARSLISKHEGKRLCVYKDTKGHPTIGIGYNLDNPGAPQAIAAVGANCPWPRLDPTSLAPAVYHPTHAVTAPDVPSDRRCCR